MSGEIVNSQIKSSHLWTFFYGSIILDAWMWHLDLELHSNRHVVLGISNPSKCLLTSVCAPSTTLNPQNSLQLTDMYFMKVAKHHSPPYQLIESHPHH
jgi:hypothetical protein